MARVFTGRHMAIAMSGFFAVVIAANATMASLAASTFGGVVVANSYVASQRFNRWLADGRAQADLGWTLNAAVAGGVPEISLGRADRPLAGAVLRVIAEHPLGRQSSRSLTIREVAAGRYRATAPLPGGRWRLKITVEREGSRARFVRDVAT